MSVHATQWEAILAAADELKSTGGGTLWIHREDCDELLFTDCDCNPVPIEVPAES